MTFASRVRSIAVACAMGIVLFASTARVRADERSAAAIFEQAREAYAQKDFSLAARKFEEANEIAPRGQTLYNAALSWESASEPARAADDYALALEDPSLPPLAQSHARDRLVHLERALLTLRIDATQPATASVAHAEARKLPATIHLRVGRHEVAVRFEDGREVRQEIEARAGERIAIKVAPPAYASARGSVTVVDQSGRGVAPSDERRTVTDTGSTQRTLGWIALGAAGIAAGSAVIFGVSGLDARDRFATSNRLDADAREHAIEMRTLANVSWVLTGAFAIGGGVLLLTAPRSSRSVAVGIGSVAGVF